MMVEAATNGDLSVMQLLVKQFVNVEGKVGMMTASEHYRLQWVWVANLWSGRENKEVVGYVNSENSHWNKGRVFKMRLACEWEWEKKVNILHEWAWKAKWWTKCGLQTIYLALILHKMIELLWHSQAELQQYVTESRNGQWLWIKHANRNAYYVSAEDHWILSNSIAIFSKITALWYSLLYRMAGLLCCGQQKGDILTWSNI